MNQNLQIIIFVIIIILVIAGFFYMKIKNENELLRSIENKMIYFYGDGCPHCANVEKFFQENNVESKIQFEKKETYSNNQNADLLSLIARKKCALPGTEIGVPFLWDGLKCILGDTPIIDFFEQKIK